MIVLQNGDTISDDWFVQLDRKLRNIVEEMKFHKEQYNRIEEALRSTGKLHDELQKQKDQLRVKDHVGLINFKFTYKAQQKVVNIHFYKN